MVKKKIGIMGGTFNPIHLGHLVIAQTALEQLKLDKVVFMPSKNPPHKRNEHILDDQVRADMVGLAIEDNPYFELSTFEMDRNGLTYTADTLYQLTKQHPEETYYFIIGADSLFYLDKWKDPATIFKYCTIVAAMRNQSTTEEMKQKINELNKQFGGTIRLLDSPNIDISSTEIRERIYNGKTVQYYVPSSVDKYMKENHLYR